MIVFGWHIIRDDDYLASLDEARAVGFVAGKQEGTQEGYNRGKRDGISEGRIMGEGIIKTLLAKNATLIAEQRR